MIRPGEYLVDSITSADGARMNARNPVASWRDAAACRGRTDVDWWPPAFEGGMKWAAAALLICAGCPVKAECLAFGAENDEYGVYGGRVNFGKGYVPEVDSPTHCHNGHEWATNYTLAVAGDRSFRRCRTCQLESNRRSEQRRKTS